MIKEAMDFASKSTIGIDPKDKEAVKDAEIIKLRLELQQIQDDQEDMIKKEATKKDILERMGTMARAKITQKDPNKIDFDMDMI